MNTEYRNSNELFSYDDLQRLQLLLEIKPYVLTRSQYLYNIFLKRLLDIIIASLAIILLLPVFIVISLIIAFESGLPIFFRQQRVGRGGTLFNICKFRTMFVNAPKNVSTFEMRNSESYITRVGKVLRRTSLDELPQLLNVLQGKMSLIGPRPLIPKEKDMDYLRKYNGIYQLRPGITGLAQIRGRDLMEIDQKIHLDCEYLRGLSFKTDLKIFFQTFLVVFRKDDVAF